MRSFWSDPYLWIHLAGLASVPLWLELCLLGLAVGDPLLPVWLELILVAAIGIVPILWMQWQRPFDIYSLLAVALKPDRLSEDQRKLLTLFTAQRNQFLAVAVAIALAVVLQKLYVIAPIAAGVTPFGTNRWLGLLVAAIAFLGANLFSQVPVAVLSVLVTSEATFAATLPFATDQIPQRFTLLGFPVNQILPAIVAEPPSPSVTVPAVPATPTVQPSVSTPSPTAITTRPESSPMPETNADDPDDIWNTDEMAEGVEPDSVEPIVSEEAPATVDTLPHEASEPASEVSTEEMPTAQMPTAAVTTEEVKPEAVQPETVQPDLSMLEAPPEFASTAEESWLDAPTIEDPASAEPPNS